MADWNARLLTPKHPTTTELPDDWPPDILISIPDDVLLPDDDTQLLDQPETDQYRTTQVKGL